MNLDPTKNAALKAPWQKRYFFARLVLLAVFITAGLYFFYRVFFPIQDYFINLADLGAKENTLSADETRPDKIILNSYSAETFSDAEIQIALDKKSSAIAGNEVKIRKTYQAFAYPAALAPAVFPEGSLVKNGKQYFIVSAGKLREFQSPALVLAMGYPEEAFQEATTEELNFSEKGSEITDAKNFPDGTVFLISGTYYQLKNQTLFPFVSEKAYLSRYEKKQALEKDASFKKNYAISEESLGFADGTLLSFDTGVFVVVSGKVVPFNNPITFLSFGYKWEDILSANEEEIGLYERDKIFTLKRPHPDGTVFFAADTGKYYLISGGRKYEIKGEHILKSYFKKNRIEVRGKNLDFQNSCALKKDWWPLNSYRCAASIKNSKQVFGNNYQIEMQKSPEISRAQIRANFFRSSISWENMRDILAEIKRKFLTNYGYATTQ